MPENSRFKRKAEPENHLVYLPEYLGCKRRRKLKRKPIRKALKETAGGVRKDRDFTCALKIPQLHIDVIAGTIDLRAERKREIIRQL